MQSVSFVAINHNYPGILSLVIGFSHLFTKRHSPLHSVCSLQQVFNMNRRERAEDPSRGIGSCAAYTSRLTVRTEPRSPSFRFHTRSCTRAQSLDLGCAGHEAKTRYCLQAT
jgi:hypothetical protein